MEFGFFVPALVFLIALISTYLVFIKQKTKIHLWKIAFISGWFLLPFCIFSVGYIRDPRYLVPALPALTFVAAYGLQKFCTCWLKRMIFGAFICAGIFSFLCSGVFPPSYFLSSTNTEKLAKLMGYEQPDPKYWHTSETVQVLASQLRLHNLPSNLLILGGTSYYNPALFQYYSRLNKTPLDIQTLPYYQLPNMTSVEAISYIRESNVAAIVYKTGLNTPEFTAKHDQDIVSYLVTHPQLYQKEDLGIQLPDGSHYWLFTLHTCQVTQPQNLPLSARVVPPVAFSSLYELIGFQQDGWNNLHFWWQKSDLTSPHNYTQFLHFTDQQDQIVTQQAQLLEQGCNLSQNDRIWEQTFPLPAQATESGTTVKIGVYETNNPVVLLPIQKTTSATDWDNHRLIFSLNHK